MSVLCARCCQKQFHVLINLVFITRVFINSARHLRKSVVMVVRLVKKKDTMGRRGGSAVRRTWIEAQHPHGSDSHLELQFQRI